MPLYPYSCSCGTVGDIITRVDEMAKCPECGKTMRRLFHSQFAVNMGPAGAHGGYDETLGHYSTNREWREKMKRAGVKEYPGKKVWFR